jgi:hypothetical protein
MNLQTLNWWAILTAAFAALLIGGAWYSPVLFGTWWVRANGFENKLPPPAGAKVLAITFLLSLVMALNLAMFLNDSKTTVVWGATAGFLAGFGWVLMSIAIIALFERRPLSYVLVNGGYVTVTLVLMGAILGAWR